jgi:hypothetical protein
MKKVLLSKVLLSLVILITLLSGSVMPVSAAAPPYITPNAWWIVSADAFVSVFEPSDQLWIVKYKIQYTDPLDQPDYTATANFIIRLVNIGVDIELKSVAPYSVFNDGYTEGYASFYFAHDDDKLPPYNIDVDIMRAILGLTDPATGSVYTAGKKVYLDLTGDGAVDMGDDTAAALLTTPVVSAYIAGNPMLSWAAPTIMTTGSSNLAVTWHNSTSTSITKMALYDYFRGNEATLGAIQNLQSFWNDLTDFQLWEYINNQVVLTEVGENYFTGAIASVNLRSLVPLLFSTASSGIVYDPDVTHDDTYAGDTSAKLTGTALDFANFGSAISGGHMTGIQASTLVSVILLLGLAIFVSFWIFRTPQASTISTLVIFNLGLAPLGFMGLAYLVYVGLFYGVEFAIAVLIFVMNKL